MNTKDICCGTSPLEDKLIQTVLSHLEELVPSGGEIHFKKGNILFYEGHLPSGFYILKNGEISLSRILLSGIKEDLTNQNKEIFGLFHLLTNTPHCAMAKAKTAIKVLFIPKSVVIDFLTKEGLL